MNCCRLFLYKCSTEKKLFYSIVIFITDFLKRIFVLLKANIYIFLLFQITEMLFLKTADILDKKF